MNDIKEVSVELKGRDHIEIRIEVKGDDIVQSRVKALGCLSHLRLVDQWRTKIVGKLSKVPLPEGNHHSELLLREALLKLKGEWMPPYSEEEICHCRVISTQVVEQAIVEGAHSCEQVSGLTTASTACGTCRSDVEGLISYRLQNH